MSDDCFKWKRSGRRREYKKQMSNRVAKNSHFSIVPAACRWWWWCFVGATVSRICRLTMIHAWSRWIVNEVFKCFLAENARKARKRFVTAVKLVAPALSFLSGVIKSSAILQLDGLSSTKWREMNRHVTSSSSRNVHTNITHWINFGARLGLRSSSDSSYSLCHQNS